MHHSSASDCLDRVQLLKQKLLNHGYVALSRRSKTCTVVITDWSTVTKYPFFRWHCIFSLSRGFSPLSPILLPNLILWITRYVSNKKQELLTHCEHARSTAYFLCGLSCSSFSPVLFVFALCHVISVLCCGFCFICLCSVSFTQYWPWLSIVHCWSSLTFSLRFILRHIRGYYIINYTADIGLVITMKFYKLLNNYCLATLFILCERD